MNLQDLRAIEALQRRFAELNDAARWQELADLFTADGRFARPSAPAQPIVGRPAILQAFLDRPPGPARRHLVANPEVALGDDGTARASCHSVVLALLGEGRGSVAVGGFHDTLRHTPAGWRFASRVGFTTVEPVACNLHDLPAAAFAAPSAPSPQPPHR